MYIKVTLTLFWFLCSIPGIAQELNKLENRLLLQDFNILTTALEEAHTGLYWYTTKQEYAQIKSAIKKQISSKASFTELEFYNLIAPLIAITKEDHCDISLSDSTSALLKNEGQYFPYLMKYIDNKAYLLNDGIALDNKLNGYELIEVNGVGIESITNKLFQTFASDGNIQSSKYRWLEDIGFSSLYAKTISWQPKEFKIKVIEPVTQKIMEYVLKPCSKKTLTLSFENFQSNFKNEIVPVLFEILDSIALLTVNTFDGRIYKESGLKFKRFIKRSFSSIRKNKIQNLVIDLRANSGGTEGYEDFLFSFLTNKAYTKYKYVESNNIKYSFYEYTDYSTKKEQLAFEKVMRKEYAYHSESGKYRRHTKIEKPEPPQKKPFTGNLFVLAGGVTYSGGAEFCSLVKQNRKAIFVGEEVGGGYYGNTSGYSFTLTLPNSKIKIEVPIVRFVLDVEGQEKGTGALPDYEVQPAINDFLNGIDTELNYTIELIKKKTLP